MTAIVSQQLGLSPLSDPKILDKLTSHEADKYQTLMRISMHGTCLWVSQKLLGPEGRRIVSLHKKSKKKRGF